MHRHVYLTPREVEAVAWDQLSKLADESGGWGGMWAGIKSFASGEGYFKGADEYMNEQARQRAKARQHGKSESSSTPGVNPFVQHLMDQANIADASGQHQLAKQLRNQLAQTHQAQSISAHRTQTNVEANDQRRISVNVTVPDGTPEDIARRISRETASQLSNQQGTASLREALVPLAR